MKDKTSKFGEFLIKLMNKYDEDIDVMANRLAISKAYLYYLISGKRSCSNPVKSKIIEIYNLDDDMINELDDCIARSKDVVKIDLSSIDDYEFRKAIIKLIYDLPNMPRNKIKEITNILNNSGGNNG